MKVTLGIDEIGRILATHVAQQCGWNGDLDIVNVWTLDERQQIVSVTIERKDAAAASPAANTNSPRGHSPPSGRKD